AHPGRAVLPCPALTAVRSPPPAARRPAACRRMRRSRMGVSLGAMGRLTTVDLYDGMNDDMSHQAQNTAPTTAATTASGPGSASAPAPVLVIGGTGKTGRRVVDRRRALGRPARVGSRSSATPFVWEDEGTWQAALDGVSAAYVTYYPDLAFPGAKEAVGRFAAFAVARGVRRLVLLSGRGEEGAVAAEDALKASGCDWTVVRANWFAQNFSESF